MEAEQIIEVVEKLVGPVRPVGKKEADNQRLENLETLIEVVDNLSFKIEALSHYKDRHEHSMKVIAGCATKWIFVSRKHFNDFFDD